MPIVAKTIMAKICGKYLNKRSLSHLETRKEMFSLVPIMAKTKLIVDTL